MKNPAPLGITDRHIPALDGLRATAAWLVVLCHLQWVPRFTNGLGALGVQIFFVISGFLITWLLLSEVAETGNLSLRAFYWRRTLRIFPAFYAAWAASIVAYIWLGIPASRREILFSGLYCQDLYLAWVYRTHHAVDWSSSFMGHSWSLGTEEKFYILWPLCVWILRRRLRMLTAFALTLVALVWVYRAISVVANVDPSYLYFAPESRIDGLMAGCAVALLARQGALRGLFHKLAAHAKFAAVVAMALLASQFFSASNRGYALAGIAIQTTLAAILLIQLVQLAPRSGWRWLDSRAAKFFAGISYSLYLWHFPVAIAAERFIQPPARSTDVVSHFFLLGVRSATIIGVSFLLAVASYHLIERPCLRWRHRSATKPAPGTLPGAISESVAVPGRLAPLAPTVEG